MFDKLYVINAGLNQRFPHGDNPFQIMTRLLEECGELAEQVNHFEDSGVKREKHGPPDRMKMAKEVMDIMRCTLQIVQHYDLQSEVEATIEESFHYWQNWFERQESSP